MTTAAGIVAEMTKAFETANVEMFAISLPDAMVIGATSAVMRRWNCTREEIVGKQLVKFGTGPLSARQITEDTPFGQVQKVEVTYVPPLGSNRSIRFTPRSILLLRIDEQPPLIQAQFWIFHANHLYLFRLSDKDRFRN